MRTASLAVDSKRTRDVTTASHRRRNRGPISYPPIGGAAGAGGKVSVADLHGRKVDDVQIARYSGRIELGARAVADFAYSVSRTCISSRASASGNAMERTVDDASPDAEYASIRSCRRWA